MIQFLVYYFISANIPFHIFLLKCLKNFIAKCDQTIYAIKMHFNVRNSKQQININMYCTEFQAYLIIQKII